MITLDRIIKRTNREISRKSKYISQKINTTKTKNKKIIFVFGCQRSGTSMMYKTFDRDPNAHVYDEISVLSNRDKIEGLRLNPLDEVERKISKSPASIVVAKPLVESQRATHLLDHFDNAQALWMFRRYQDVVNSNLKRFGKENGIYDIKSIIENDQSNWRCEALDPNFTDVVKEFGRDATHADAAALFWLARNHHFFLQNLLADKRVYLCRYETLVTNPAPEIARIYDHFSLGKPGDKLLSGISSRSIGKGSDVKLSPPIEQLCNQMLSKLDSFEGPQGKY